MKANKILLIATTAFMYVCHLPLYIVFIFGLFDLPIDPEIQNNLFTNLIKVFLGLNGLIFPLLIALTVLSIISIFKGNTSPIKTTFICKLVTIPWFILNFAMCTVVIAGLFNPFLMIAIPILIPIMVFTTYLFMFATSLPNIFWTARVFIKRMPMNKGLLIAGTVLLFIFCLDIAGAIMHYVAERNMIKNSQ